MKTKHNNMGNKITALLLTIVLMSVTGIGDNKPLDAKLSLTDWQNGLDAVERAKDALNHSNIAAGVVLPLVDSLNAFENRIVPQLKQQIADTTTKKK